MDLIAVIQGYIATTAIGPSTLRNQGAPGVVECARSFLATLEISLYSGTTQLQYHALLDRHTDAMLASFPATARNWGAARKAMNLFLRDALYNVYLCRQYALQSIEAFLELPLDGVVAGSLKELDTQGVVPRWPGLKSLDKKTSDRYQVFADDVASTMGIPRVHLDAWLWTKNREGSRAG